MSGPDMVCRGLRSYVGAWYWGSHIVGHVFNPSSYLLPYLSGFLLQGDRLKQVKTTETARWDLV